MSKPTLRAILVSVDYGDFLELSLSYNRHHFDEVMVVTTPTDQLSISVAEENGAKVFCTDSFYDEEADFNKWKALEQGLDAYGRHGNICLMDADIFWPKKIPDWEIRKDCLYTPYCHIFHQTKNGMPSEEQWPSYGLRAHKLEFPGYTQIFNAKDAHLPKYPPWHQINWRHAGGADSFFQKRWRGNYRQRPPFYVLHLGQSGKNWCGRFTKYIDGTKPEEGMKKFTKLRGYMNKRRSVIRKDRKIHSHTYDHEKLPIKRND